MSLDIDLVTKDVDGNSIFVWDTNITHNLGNMAGKAGLYEVMWRPEEIGVTTAKQALPLLIKGVKYMIDHKEELQKLNPENGWGSYDGLFNCASEYLTKCRQYPSATIEVSS